MPIYSYMKGGKEHWYYAFEVKDKKGKRKTIKQRGYTGKTEARAAERNARVAWEKGQYIDPSKLTCAQFFPAWLEQKQDISGQTRYTYECHLENHIIPAFKDTLLQRLDIEDIERLVKELQAKKVRDKKGNEKNLSSGTIKKVFNMVSNALRYAMSKGYILVSPIDKMEKGTKPRVTKKQIEYWNKEEVKQFLGSFDHRLKAMFILAIYTGMRRGEILGLRWKDVDFDNNQIRIRQILAFNGEMKAGAKTQAGNRSISMSPLVVSELKKRRTAVIQEKWAAQAAGNEYKDGDLIFCDAFGKHVSWGNFHKFWKRRVAKSGVRYIRFHDLRHTCASLLLSAVDPKTGRTIHPKVVQELLGHSSIKITLDLYSHLMPNIQADAVNSLEQMLNS